MTESVRLLTWVDARFPPSLARWLTQHAGIDAHHVSEFDVVTAADVEIFAAARANHVEVVVTKDDDFVPRGRAWKHCCGRVSPSSRFGARRATAI